MAQVDGAGTEGKQVLDAATDYPRAKEEWLRSDAPIANRSLTCVASERSVTGGKPPPFACHNVDLTKSGPKTGTFRYFCNTLTILRKTQAGRWFQRQEPPTPREARDEPERKNRSNAQLRGPVSRCCSETSQVL